MSNSDAEVTDFNTVEQLSLSVRAEGKVKINRSQVDYSSLNSISADLIQEHLEYRVRTLTERHMDQAYQDECQSDQDKEEGHLRKKSYEAYEAQKVHATNVPHLIASQLPFSLVERDKTILCLMDLRDRARTNVTSYGWSGH